MSVSFNPFLEMNTPYFYFCVDEHGCSVSSTGQPACNYTNAKPRTTFQSIRHPVNVEHPFIPHRIDRRCLGPSIEPRTTTAPIARPLKIHSPKPDKRFVKAPFWLFEDCEWDTKGRLLPSATASVRGVVCSNMPLPNPCNMNTERPSERSPSSPSFTESIFDSTSTPTSSSTLDSDIGTSSLIYIDRYTDVVFQALQLAKCVLEMNVVWENPYGTNNKEELLKQWQAIYAMVRIAIERGFDAGTYN